MLHALDANYRAHHDIPQQVALDPRPGRFQRKAYLLLRCLLIREQPLDCLRRRLRAWAPEVP
eukprot:3237915-Lingulodinium_polyedra.AAC.1